MKRYSTWGVDASYRFKWQARLAGWWFWTKRGNSAQAKLCLTHKYGV